MDRIHNAIAKARASRDGSITGHRTGKANLPQPSKDGIDWSTLTELRLSPTVLDENRLVAHRAGDESTAFDLMRVNLVRQLQEHRWSRVAITSPGAGCGKTTVALNLAFSLARLTDIRVMVLELDLRRPSMMRSLGIERRQDFAGVLAGKEAPEEQITRWGRNLAFGLNSAQVPNSAELLSSDRAADMIDVIEDTFRPDIMLFDMPPMMVGDDTLAFIDQVDCALMIAAAEETAITQIQQCGKELAAHTQVLGVVLNKCRLMASHENYGYDA